MGQLEFAQRTSSVRVKLADTDCRKRIITFMSFFDTFFSTLFKLSSESQAEGTILGLMIFCFNHFWAGPGESPIVLARPCLAPVIMVSKFNINIEEYILSSFSADTDLVFDRGGAGHGPVVIFLAEGASAGLV